MQTKLCSGRSTANDAYLDGPPVTVTAAPSTQPKGSHWRAVFRAARGIFFDADMPVGKNHSSAGNGSYYANREGYQYEKFSYR